MSDSHHREPFLLHAALIILLGAAIYSNTLGAPFQWDDTYFVSENPVIKDLGNFVRPGGAEGMELYPAVRARYVGYLSFALDYALHGLRVEGYHAVNLAVHIGAALLLYLLVRLSFGTPFLAGSAIRGRAGGVAFFSALLFVAHPVQTEAVTYVFQRFASLAALFYLGSLAAYAGARLSPHRARGLGLYALSLLSALLAMKSKESAFTLPLAVALYEFSFMEGPVRGRLPWLLPFAPLLLVVPLSLASPGGGLGGVLSVARGYWEIRPMEYLFTQFRVIITYLRLLFLPVNQSIDYGYPLQVSIWEPGVLISLFVLSALLCLSIGLYLASRRGEPAWRLMGFGILWFFLALSVESSVIPIPMLMAEYRLYLPSAGPMVAMAVWGTLMASRAANPLRTRRAIALLSALLVIALSAAAYARNGLWGSGISLWQDTVDKNPRSARAENNLGRQYLDMGMPVEAVERFRKALALREDYPDALNNLGRAYEAMGKTAQAVEQYRAAIGLDPSHAEAHNNLGSVYMSTGEIEKAAQEFAVSVRLSPSYADAHSNLAVAYRALGMMDEAEAHLRTAARLKPESEAIRLNLAVLLIERGNPREAAAIVKQVLRTDPRNRQAGDMLKELFPPGR